MRMRVLQAHEEARGWWRVSSSIMLSTSLRQGLLLTLEPTVLRDGLVSEPGGSFRSLPALWLQIYNHTQVSA